MCGIPLSSMSHIILAFLDLKCPKKWHTLAVRTRVDRVTPGYLTATCQRATENLHGEPSGLHLVCRQTDFMVATPTIPHKWPFVGYIPKTANRYSSRLNVCCVNEKHAIGLWLSVNVSMLRFIDIIFVVPKGKNQWRLLSWRATAIAAATKWCVTCGSVHPAKQRSCTRSAHRACATLSNLWIMHRRRSFLRICGHLKAPTSTRKTKRT